MGTPRSEGKKTVSLRLDHTLYDLLQDLAESQGKTATAVATELLSRALAAGPADSSPTNDKLDAILERLDLVEHLLTARPPEPARPIEPEPRLPEPPAPEPPVVPRPARRPPLTGNPLEQWARATDEDHQAAGLEAQD